MLKTTTLLRPILVGLAAISLLFTSCKDDDEPASGAEISFTTDAMTIGEGDGTIEVELVLSKPAPRNFRLTYDVGGTAIEGTTPTADFDIQGSFGRIDINKGETSAFIEIVVKQDDTSEGDEVIVITLDDVNENGIKIGSDDEITITIADDDDDAPFYTVSFVETEFTKFESDGLIEIAVSIDPAPAEDVTIMYEIDLETMALDSLLGYEEEIPQIFWDYHINGTSGELTISAGETSGKIEIELYSDSNFELYEHGDFETIILNLKESSGIQFGDNETTTINVRQEDGKIIGLFWEESYQDVDMDMLLWKGADISSFNRIVGMAANARTTPNLEALFVPLNSEGSYGLSYIYYSGTPDPMNFEVNFIDYVNGEFEADEDVDIFEASYTDANKNEWDTEDGLEPMVVQTFRKVDGSFVELTEITVPISGSRMKSYTIPSYIKKENNYSVPGVVSKNLR